MLCVRGPRPGVRAKVRGSPTFAPSKPRLPSPLRTTLSASPIGIWSVSKTRGLLIGANRTEDGELDPTAAVVPPPATLATDIPLLSTSVYLWPKECIKAARSMEGSMVSRLIRGSTVKMLRDEVGTSAWWKEVEHGARLSVAATALALENKNIAILKPYMSPQLYDLMSDKFTPFCGRYDFSLKMNKIRILNRWTEFAVEFPDLKNEVTAIWQPTHGCGVKFSIPKTPEIADLIEARDKAQTLYQARVAGVIEEATKDPEQAGQLLHKIERQTFLPDAEKPKALASMTKEELKEQLQPITKLQKSFISAMSRGMALRANGKDLWNFMRVMQEVRPGYAIEKATVKVTVGVLMSAVHDVVVWRKEDEHQEIVHQQLEAPHVAIFEHSSTLDGYTSDAGSPYWIMSDLDGAVTWNNAMTRRRIDGLSQVMGMKNLSPKEKLKMENQLARDLDMNQQY